MKRSRASWAAGALAAALFFGGAIHLFDRQFASGELYPEFSSLRADRMGTKLLYDSLGRMPGITVERNYLPVAFLPRDGATLLLLGLDPMGVDWDEGGILRSVEQIAGRGNRVVMALYVDVEDLRFKPEQLEKREDSDSGGKAGKRSQKPPPDAPVRARWKVKIKLDPEGSKAHPLYFESADGWRVIEQADGRTLAIERDFGKGSVALLAESADFANAAAVELNRLDSVAAALGPYRRIVFDEQHLGIVESGSVVGMARKFRLMGLAFGLALVGALFIWRNASGFPPPAESRAVERCSGRTSHSGLITLLQRHIPPPRLAAACWQEWLSANGREADPEIRARAEAILQSEGGNPVEAARRIQTLLESKGRT